MCGNVRATHASNEKLRLKQKCAEGAPKNCLWIRLASFGAPSDKSIWPNQAGAGRRQSILGAKSVIQIAKIGAANLIGIEFQAFKLVCHCAGGCTPGTAFWTDQQDETPPKQIKDGKPLGAAFDPQVGGARSWPAEGLLSNHFNCGIAVGAQ